MRFALVLPVVAVLALSTFAASAAAPAKPAVQDKDKQEAPSEREDKASLAIAATPVLPIGNLSDGLTVGLGATLGFDYLVAPKVALVARTGFIHHLTKSSLDVTLDVIPVWGGARYSFLGEEGPYVEGALGPTVLFASARIRGASASDTSVRIGLDLGGGYRIGKLDVGGRVVFYDVGHAGDSTGLMATVGWSFASF